MPHAPESDEYDAVTRESEDIREWVERWGGEPATTSSGEQPAIAFEDDAETTAWEDFFETLREGSYALAYETGDPAERDTPPAHEFVRRPDGEGDRRSDPDADDPPADDVLDGPDDDVAERESAEREAAARAQENPDNHRDREPFVEE